MDIFSSLADALETASSYGEFRLAMMQSFVEAWEAEHFRHVVLAESQSDPPEHLIQHIENLSVRLKELQLKQEAAKRDIVKRNG